MEALCSADFGIIGEAELTINELAYALEMGESASNIPAVVDIRGNRGGGILKSEDIPDLDMLPFPDYIGFEYAEIFAKPIYSNYTTAVGKRVAHIVLSRSCPYNCTFCFHSSGQRYRRRTLDNIFLEIDWLVREFNIDTLAIQDELFVSNKQFINGFCDRIREYNLKWWGQTRVDTVTKDMLCKMRDSGCVIMNYGVESADNSILKSMKKNITVDQIEHAFLLADEVGIKSNGNVIFGDIAETPQTIKNSLNWFYHHKNYSILLDWIRVFPGSHLYKVACETRIIDDKVQYLRDGCPQINITKMPEEEYWRMVDEVTIYNWIIHNSDSDTIFDGDYKVALRNNIEFLVNYFTCGIWAAFFPITPLLFRLAPSLNADNVYLININADKLSENECQFNGKRVNPPSIIQSAKVNLIISPNRIAEFNQICEIVDREYPEVQEVFHISELMKPGLW